MADFSNIIQETNRVIYDNESGGITSSSLRLLILDIINEIENKKADKVHPDEDEIIYGIPVITSCSYKNGTINGNGATISKSDFNVSYTQSWTKNGQSMSPITSGGTVEISLNQQNGFGNSVTIPPNTSGNIIDRNIYVHVKMNGQTSSPELKTIPQDVIHTDELIYAEIPITDNDLIDIVVNNTKNISDFVTQSAILSNISDRLPSYNTDDGNPAIDTDVYTLDTARQGVFLSVFLLSNKNHEVILINPLTNYPEPIVGSYPNKIYQSNDFQYNDTSYKILAVIQKTNSNIFLKIQIKDL